MIVSATGSTYVPSPLYARAEKLRSDIDRLKRKIARKRLELRLIGETLKITIVVHEDSTEDSI